jgi:hypothetical protein
LTVYKFLITEFTAEQARIGTGGLYLDTRRAIEPVSVTQIIRSKFRSSTVETAADAIDSAVPSGGFV